MKQPRWLIHRCVTFLVHQAVESRATAQAMFYIHPLEQPLIDAAIRLGEWMVANATLTDAERAQVAGVLNALRRLPEVTPGVSGSFGFRFADNAVENWDGKGEVPMGDSESWSVCYYPAQDQVWLEIFNHRWTFPQHDTDDLYDIQFELDFLRTSLDTDKQTYSEFTPSSFQMARMYDWINCADLIERFQETRENFAIEID